MAKCKCGHEDVDHWTQHTDFVYRQCEMPDCNCEHYEEAETQEQPTGDSE